MKSESRVHKSLINVKINVLFYIITLFFTFFSRRVFLSYLSADFVGLAGTFNNILSFLNLAEFGIGSSIAFFLYKPLQCKDREKISEIISILGYLYHIIGFVLLAGGITISLFFPLMFKDSSMGFGIIYFTFFSFLGSSLIGYFINFRQLLLTADQKMYIVSAYFQTANIFRSIVQIISAYYLKNLYIWVSIELIFSLLNCIVLNWRISKEYSWLDTHIKNGKRLLKQYPDILNKTKQVFIHRIKDFALYKSDEILVFAFVSLKMVAYYGNYMIIINKINLLINMISDGMAAGIGNLLAEGDKKNTIKVYWELNAIRMFLTSIIIFTFICFLDPFIALWVGPEYILNRGIVSLLLLNLFIYLARGTNEMYIHSFGLFGDTWAAWTELATNLLITFTCAPSFGLIGILLGKVISVFGIAILWKPYFLFKKGFNVPVSVYWKQMLKYYALTLLPISIFYIPVTRFVVPLIDNFFYLVLYGIPVITLYTLVCFAIFLIFTTGMKHFIKRIPFLDKML